MDQRNEGGKKSRAVEGHGPVFLGSVAGYWVWLMADEVLRGKIGLDNIARSQANFDKQLMFDNYEKLYELAI